MPQKNNQLSGGLEMQLYNLRNKQLASQYVATEFLKQIKHRPDAVFFGSLDVLHALSNNVSVRNNKNNLFIN